MSNRSGEAGPGPRPTLSNAAPRLGSARARQSKLRRLALVFAGLGPVVACQPTTSLGRVTSDGTASGEPTGGASSSTAGTGTADATGTTAGTTGAPSLCEPAQVEPPCVSCVRGSCCTVLEQCGDACVCIVECLQTSALPLLAAVVDCGCNVDVPLLSELSECSEPCEAECGADDTEGTGLASSDT